jgi:hypothetical protein
MFGGVVRVLLWVESYILVLLYSLVVQSTIFTNMSVVWVEIYLNVVHEHNVQFNKQ